jgi:hypothetical protein
MKAQLFIMLACLVFNSTSIMAQTAPYYPLRVGDRWEFNGPLSKAIKDTTMPNHEKHVVIINSDTTLGSTRYERYDSNRVFQFNSSTMKEELLFDFSKVPGDTVSIIPRLRDTLRIIFWGTTEDSILGKLRKVWLFIIDTVGIGDNVTVAVADSIGIIGYRGPFGWISKTISGAVIDGNPIRISYPYIYLPMQTGNWWKYDDGSETYILKDTTMPNGKDYAMELSGGNATYLRQDKYFMYRYDTSSQTETVAMDMSAPAGQIWDLEYGGNDLDRFTSWGIDTESVFSTSKRIFTCDVSSTECLDCGAEQSYADSIGFINWQTMLSQSSLVEAYVGGKHYIATSVNPRPAESPAKFLLN